MKIQRCRLSVNPEFQTKVIALALLSLILLPLAHAGTINGTIREGNKPLRNTQIVIACGGENYLGTTSERGSYSINVQKTGRCTLTLPGMQNAKHSIASSNNPVRYDFTVQKTNAGYILKRR